VNLPEPDSDQYQQGPRESGHDVPQRDCNVVEADQKTAEAKYEAADDGANQAEAEIANQAKALSLTDNYHPSKTAAYKADGDPKFRCGSEGEVKILAPPPEGKPLSPTWGGPWRHETAARFQKRIVTC
jgi:hypothetical protein